MVVVEVLVSPVLFRHLVLLFTAVVDSLLAGLLPAAAGSPGRPVPLFFGMEV